PRSLREPAGPEFPEAAEALAVPRRGVPAFPAPLPATPDSARAAPPAVHPTGPQALLPPSGENRTWHLPRAPPPRASCLPAPLPALATVLQDQRQSLPSPWVA